MPETGESDTSTILGIETKLIEKIRPLPNARANAFPHGVNLSWPEDGKGYNGGMISFYWSTGLDSSGELLSVDESPPDSQKFLNASFFEHPRGEYNSFEGLAIVLTGVATIKRVAALMKQEVVQLVKANKNSLPYFERFRKAGVFGYCDWSVRAAGHPFQTPAGNRLFRAVYPQPRLSFLDKFIVEDVARLLSKELQP